MQKDVRILYYYKLQRDGKGKGYDSCVGCPKIVNIGTAKTDMFYEQKKYGFRKR